MVLVVHAAVAAIDVVVKRRGLATEIKVRIERGADMRVESVNLHGVEQVFPLADRCGLDAVEVPARDFRREVLAGSLDARARNADLDQHRLVGGSLVVEKCFEIAARAGARARGQPPAILLYPKRIEWFRELHDEINRALSAPPFRAPGTGDRRVALDSDRSLNRPAV